jgi:hypothetical protein
MVRPYACVMFADSDVFAVPGVEFVAFVDRTTSQNTGTAVAVTPSNPIRNFLISPPNVDGVITIRAVFAVAAASATAAVLRSVYPDLGISHTAVASRTSAPAATVICPCAANTSGHHALPVELATAEAGDVDRRAARGQRTP